MARLDYAKQAQESEQEVLGAVTAWGVSSFEADKFEYGTFKIKANWGQAGVGPFFFVNKDGHIFGDAFTSQEEAMRECLNNILTSIAFEVDDFHRKYQELAESRDRFRERLGLRWNEGIHNTPPPKFDTKLPESHF